MFKLARIICEERNLYRLQISFNQTIWATVSGKLHFNALSRLDYPAVGDWVLVDCSSQSDRGIIQEVLDRKTMIYRKQVGVSYDKQILSTNIDRIFITTSVNEDLNYRRIERYLALAYDSKAMPIILLTKSDVYDGNISNLILEISNYFPDVAIHCLSYQGFDSADFLKDYLNPGSTSVFIGSSGVGKSTLVNYLIDINGDSGKIRTQEIRDSDGRGRHTTTSRNLYISRFGGLVIDTPGMRELQLHDHVDGLSDHFFDIEMLANNCKFNDCKHNTEPSCAIKSALDDGSLQFDRWLNYQKLKAEISFAQRKQDKHLAQQEKKKLKKLTVMAQNKSRFKRGDFDYE